MTPAELLATMEATWPAAEVSRVGGWHIRRGDGGGKRVSAATAAEGWQVADIPQAVAAMAALGQAPLFLIREGDEALDSALAARGYAVVDPVVGYAAPVENFAEPVAMTGFAHWPPMQIARDLWAEGGIGPARIAVMERVPGAKCAVLGRSNDRAAGVAFVAIHQGVAMLHGLEVSPQFRRQGTAQNILRHAAWWSGQNGATMLSLVVTTANLPARRLYSSFGMIEVGSYHYRQG